MCAGPQTIPPNLFTAFSYWSLKAFPYWTFMPPHTLKYRELA
ncbi:hypothetical protein T11_1396 [Trichinella zimbabwensis]|uniref:Uncharacterized protein n=1 Tax=Trichinella zimbabwensis TaxID=268475 RepID=A0A0V1GUP3_9BILA|nr:hypothetical protein T11_17556 [Trichinella zimbabwensis]KRZ01781.1 hypothetical protein T11_1396 [Trichinella zimbabwensis]